MKRVFLMAVLAAVCGVVCAEEDTNLFGQVYDFFYPWCVTNSPEGFSEAKVKEGLSQFGVTWPQGSGVYKVPASCDKIVVLNNEKNLRLCHDLMDTPTEISWLIEARYDVFAFRAEDIEKVISAGGVDCESLVALRKQGRAKLVTTAQTVTKTGQEAVVRNCDEILFPTEIQQGVASNQVSASWSLVPANFEMREIGTILQFVAEVSADGTRINIMLNPQWVTLNRWESFEARAGTNKNNSEIEFKQPIFNVSKLQTQLTLNSGEIVLLGGGKPADDGKTMLYHFMTAKLIKKGRPK